MRCDSLFSGGEICWFSICAAFAAGEWLGFSCGRLARLWPTFAIASFAVAVLAYSFCIPKWHMASAFSLGLVLAMHASNARIDALEEALEVNAGRACTVTARIAEDARPAVGGKGRRWIRLPAALGPVPVEVIASVPARADLPKAGEEWQFTGWLDRSREDDHSKRRSLWVKGRGSGMKRTKPRKAGAWSMLRNARDSFSRRLGIGLDGEAEFAGMSRALLLGERGELDPAYRRAFVDSGTSHVFAISGLHVMIVAKLLSYAALLCFAGRRIGSALVVPALWAYVAMVGASPSAVRAALMSTFYFGATVFWRRPNSAVSWSLAFMAIHVASPQSIMSVGSRLSFAVMLALVIWGRWTSRLGRSPLDPVMFASVAWIAGTPIVASSFGRFTAGGLVANFFMVWAAEAAVVSSSVGIAASYVSTTAASYANHLTALVLRIMAGCSETIAGIPYSSVKVERWSCAECLAWYAVFGGAAWLASRMIRRRRLFLEGPPQERGKPR